MASKTQMRGFKKATSKPPDKKQVEMFGPKPVKQPSFNIPGDRSFGEKVPVIGSSRTATASMQGKAPPKTKGKTSTRSDGRKQFKPKGAKVF